LIEVLKVSSKSNPNSVAGALAGVIRTHGSAEVQVVGAGALNQAIKAVAIARGYMAPSGHDLTCQPTFTDIRIDGESRTAIRLEVQACQLRAAAPPAGGWSRPTAPASPAGDPLGDPLGPPGGAGPVAVEG
jgi:stage V sporulation protein S